MEKKISIVIPNYNGADTIGECLMAAFASKYSEFEVVVVDDCSGDNSVEIINKFPCKLVRLEKRSGTSKARNIGAESSTGDFIFFTDADCLLQEDTLLLVNKALSETDLTTVLGGTYTRMPHDKDFFSIFQSVYINYSETKKSDDPDYIAAHAMIIDAGIFRKSGGFPEDFLPIIEDVELSHRLRRSGCRLIMDPGIQVRHIFNFSLVSSLRNAFKKSAYWNMYSLKNRDLLADSGTASLELKTDVVSYCLNLVLLLMWGLTHKNEFLIPAAFILMVNIFVRSRLFKSFFETKGGMFAGLAAFYYIVLYPLPVVMGTIAAIFKHILR